MEEIGRRHSVNKGNNLRAAVFGINDGLVSNASLILGIIGANTDPQIVVLTGVAGLLAGAFSMAAGEFVSVSSQRELYEYQIGLKRKKKQDRNNAGNILTPEELGLNINELISPYSAAFYSFLFFMIGACLPLSPYLISDKMHHLYSVVIITSLSLLTIGALVSLFTGRTALKGAGRMLMIGLGACLVTYYIGHHLGVMLL